MKTDRDANRDRHALSEDDWTRTTLGANVPGPGLQSALQLAVLASLRRYSPGRMPT
jgi:hypothetical protein